MKKMARGFTLIEIMVAAAVLSGGIIWIVNSFKTIYSTIEKNRETYEAYCVLEQKLFELNLIKETRPETENGEIGNYKWESITESIENSKLKKLDIKIRDRDDNNAAVMEVYLYE